MIETSNHWQDAVTGDVRRVRVRIPARITDPDLEYGTVTATSEAAFSWKDQVIDGVFTGAGDYATGEMNRWILNGPQTVLRSSQTLVSHAVDWDDISSTTYPVGWYRGYYDKDDGTHHDSYSYIRSSGAPVSSTFVQYAGATRLVCAAPEGYAIAAYEYEASGTFVKRHGNADSAAEDATGSLDFRFPAGHKFRFTVGKETGMGNSSSENYKLGDDTFVSTITATFYVYNYDGEIGWVSGSLSGSDGTFSTAPVLSVALSGVEALRAVTVQFPEGTADGYGVNFTVTAKASGSVLDTVLITDNAERRVLVTMSAANPDTIEVSVSKWSLPSRRARIVEVYPGWAVDWTASDITGLDVKFQCSLSTMQQPYSTASVTLDNTGNLFDPLDKSSMFQAIEEGQGFPVELGVDVDGVPEYVPLGVFYHHNQGWSQKDSNMTMQWSLVDIIGLLSDVDFAVPETVPTTLSGWLSAIVACLGTRFEGHYGFDPEYLSSYAITAEAEDVTGKKCGELLRMLCQASGCIAMTRREDGALLMRSAMDTGPDMTLDNLSEYPTFKANDYLGSITFTLPDGEGGTEDYEIIGTDNTVKNTAKISNPFITTESGATDIAARIFSAYGGNKISLRGRGEPSAELGDVVWVQTKTGQDASGRILSQTFKYSGGVLEGCQTELLHTETRYNTFGHRVVFTEDGTWTVPEGVTSVHVVLVGGGDGGGYGYLVPSQCFKPFYNRSYVEKYGQQRPDGSYEYNITIWYALVDNTATGKSLPDGETGKGGKVFSREVAVNPGDTMSIVIGEGGAAPGPENNNAVPGTPTTFGVYTSENGDRYSGAYTDIYAGGTYAKSGQSTVTANSGNGGKGGGHPWSSYSEVNYEIYRDTAYNQYVSRLVWPLEWKPESGSPTPLPQYTGTDGSSGICIIYYNDPEEAET